jgi:hypothetical protein
MMPALLAATVCDFGHPGSWGGLAGLKTYRPGTGAPLSRVPSRSLGPCMALRSVRGLGPT